MHDPAGTDLSYIWAGARAVLDGGNPYDAASWQASVDRLGTQAIGIPPVYTYPPVVLLDQVLLVLAIPLVAGDLAARGHRHAALWLTAVAGLGMIGLSWWLRLVVASPLGSEAVLGLVTVFVAVIVAVPAVAFARPASSRR